MRNAVVGCMFFCFLVLGVAVGLYFNRVELFGVIGLGAGLLSTLLFRKKN